MAKDLTVYLEDRPGTLAELGEALGKAGVNIEGGCGVQDDGTETFHLLFEDGAAARQAIEDAGIKVQAERDVIVTDVQDRPGALGGIARAIADAGVNIKLVYMATNNRLVIGASDLDKVRAAL
jgi:hypothetical protein